MEFYKDSKGEFSVKKVFWSIGVVFLALGVIFAVSGKVDAATNDAQRFKTVGANKQLILVTTPGYKSNKATVQTFERDSKGVWQRKALMYGYIGRDGFAKTMRETVVESPRGKFTIGTAFGRYANPGTKMPYRKTSTRDVWVDDVKSKLYNSWQVLPVNNRWKSAEKLYQPAYNYAFVINYNPLRKPGWGSAIFFHVSSSYTMGCTGTSQANVVKILKWLDPKKKPVIIQTPRTELSRY